MNNTESLLLLAVIIILVGLIVYSFYTSSRFSKKRSAESQAASLKLMLSEYAQKVQKEQREEGLYEIDVDIPTKVYPKFDNSRAVDEMGLSQEEADGFVLELIKVIEAEVLRIEAALKKNDIKTIEDIVHTLTGTSSTLGSGGISSALISFYSAVQHRDTLRMLQIHLENVKYYLKLLKEESGVS